jgi:Tfp pilus assembly PilM family ATPase
LSDLSIFHESQLKITRSIPLDFTLGAEISKVVEEEQEMFHSFVDQDYDFKNVCNDLAYEIERLMNFYRYTLNNREHEFSLLLIAGDVPRLKDIMENITGRLTFKISIMAPVGFISNSPFSELVDIFPSIAVPIGLALRGNKH